MRKQLFISTIFILSAMVTNAQWTGTNPIWTSSNIGIGIENPVSPFHVNGSVGLSWGYDNIKGLATIGDKSGGSLLIRMPGLDMNGWYAGFGIDGSYNSGVTSVNFKALGVPSLNTVYKSEMVFHTSIANVLYERMKIDVDGNVGIGKTNPFAKLDVSTGYVFFDVGNENRVVISDDATNTNADSPKLSFFGRDYSGSHITGPSIQKINEASYGRGRLAIFQHGGADYTSEKEVMSILPDGNVGIGTIETGTHKLAVEGTIGAREIKVEAEGWSDFVFEKDYDLKDLKEVETYIKNNKHLPDIPSEKEVLENGVQLGEMNAKLLQKIEELTLYMIEQNKKTEKLIEKVDILESENKVLKEKVEKIEISE